MKRLLGMTRAAVAPIVAFGRHFVNRAGVGERPEQEGLGALKASLVGLSALLVQVVALSTGLLGDLRPVAAVASWCIATITLVFIIVWRNPGADHYLYRPYLRLVAKVLFVGQLAVAGWPLFSTPKPEFSGWSIASQQDMDSLCSRLGCSGYERDGRTLVLLRGVLRGDAPRAGSVYEFGLGVDVERRGEVEIAFVQPQVGSPDAEMFDVSSSGESDAAVRRYRLELKSKGTWSVDLRVLVSGVAGLTVDENVYFMAPRLIKHDDNSGD